MSDLGMSKRKSRRRYRSQRVTRERPRGREREVDDVKNHTVHSHCICPCSLSPSLVLAFSLSGSAFGMTILLISASVRDYNDNAASCFARGGERGRGAPEGRSSFSGKVFPTQMRHRTRGLFISTAVLFSCVSLPFKRAGQQVAASTSLAVAFLLSRPVGVYLYADKSRVRRSLILSSMR